MSIKELDKIYNDNITFMYDTLKEVIEQSSLELKNELLTFLSTNAQDVKKLIFILTIIYSLLAFGGKKHEIVQSKHELDKLTATQPLLKELIAIYYQMVSVGDINTNLKDKELAEKQKQLEDVLFA